MKYQTLDSKQRANYWALMNLIDLFHQYLGEDHPQANNFCTDVSILESNLNLELFTDDEVEE